MANIILFDSEVRENLLPLTFIRPVCEMRVGILTIKEKWAKRFDWDISYITQDYLAEKYPIDHGKENYLINGSALPSEQLCTLIRQMEFGEALLDGDELIVAKMDDEQLERLVSDEDIDQLQGFDLIGTDYVKINNLWDLYLLNDREIRHDFELLTKGRKSQPLSDTNQVVGGENVFVEAGAKVECSIINATTGPVYIGENAEVMEGCIIRGSFALCEEAVLKMGARVYEGTTIGPVCKVGGEIDNSIFFGYSNKAHNGYMGNSIIGTWCNLGADTNTSNLKNDYVEIRQWNYPDGRFIPTGQQFCGLVMGDYSRSGISTMFNSGSVVGISSNVFGSGFPRNFIPSFSWGGPLGYRTYRTDKAFEMIERVIARRDRKLNVEDRLILLRIFEETVKHRGWDKKET